MWSCCVETRVGVRSGGGSRLEGAQSFFDVLRLILGPPNARFEVLCFVGYIYVILRPSCIDRVPVIFQKNFEIFHKQGPYKVDIYTSP